jgi:hypothetical protein
LGEVQPLLQKAGASLFCEGGFVMSALIDRVRNDHISVTRLFGEEIAAELERLTAEISALELDLQTERCTVVALTAENAALKNAIKFLTTKHPHTDDGVMKL